MVSTNMIHRVGQAASNLLNVVDDWRISDIQWIFDRQITSHDFRHVYRHLSLRSAI